MMLPSTLPIARYRFIFQIVEPVYLPEYAGSALRGAFGRALRKISCMTKQDNCKTCPLYRTCPYPSIFETPAPKEHQLQKFSQVPNGYVIEPPEWGMREYHRGEKLQFEMVLFGKLIAHLPLIAFAWQRAFEYNVAKGKGKLVEILHLSQENEYSILQNGHIIDHITEVNLPEVLPENMELNLITPLRLQQNGVPFPPNQIQAERFLMTMAKRLSLLSEFHATPLALDFTQLSEQLADISESKQLKWQDWTRYSSRQDQKMKLGGVIGSWQLDKLSSQWASIVYIGQWLHCGKNASFGLGKYEITNLYN